MLKRRFRLIKQGLDDGSVLDDLNDVSVASPTSGYTIFWNGTTWVDGDITNLSGYVAPVTDHGALTGLADDDHTQYAQHAAAETISGDWVFTGNFNIGDPGSESGSIQVNGASFTVLGKVNHFGGGYNAEWVWHHHSTTANNSANIVFAKANSGTSAHGDVTNGHYLGQLNWVGWHTSSYYLGAVMHVEVDGTPGVSDMPTKFVFSTSSDGSATPTARLTINAAGATVVGDVSGTTIGGITEANLVDKSATETISAAWTFTTGPTLSSGTPLIYWRETDQTTDEQYWRTSVAAKSWILHAASDDLLTLRAAFTATRGTTYAISGVALGNSTDLPMTTVNGGLRVVHTRSPGTIAADQDDYAPTGYETVFHLRLASSPAAYAINGFAGGQTGRILNITNTGGTYDLILAHEAGTSTAANRFSFENSQNHRIKPGANATVIYDGSASRWKLVTGHSAAGLTTKGDLLSYGTYADRLAVGTDGHVLTADSTQTLGVKWAAASGGGGGAAVLGYNPKYLYDWFDDLHSFDDEGWVTVTSGTGAAASQSTTRCSGTHFGVVELSTGTTSTGYSGAAFRATTPTTDVSTGYVLDSDDLILECLFYVEQVPTAAQNSAVRIGLVSDIDNPDINDTVQLRLRYNAAAVWTTATAGGSITSNDYSSPAPATGWHHLKIVANSSSVKYYIDGTLLETCTTNIPTGAMVPSMWINKTAGTTAHLLSVDTIWIHKEFSAARNSNLSEPSVAFGIDALSDVDTTTDAPSNADLLRFDGTNWVPTDIKIFSGTGSPESVVTANVGSLYLRTDGGASTTLYVKESGTGNTGWVAK